MVVPTPKLTKRQRKGIAFRERKRGKRIDNPPGILEEENNVPSLKDQAFLDATQDQQGGQVGAEALVGGGKTGAEDQGDGRRMVVAARKAKRKVEEEEMGNQSELKRPRPDGRPFIDADEREAGRETDAKAKQRFILFLGNLKYSTTSETIQAHFSVCVPPPTVRLLTPKPSTKSPMKPVTKSKGCAFLEFNHRGALQQGLKLHHSHLDGRQINVELTAGGGGKGAARMQRLKERNKELEGQRRKQHGPKADAQSGAAQHLSTTSGGEQTHSSEPTRTIRDVDENKAHQNSQGHQGGPKKRRSVNKDFGTGVNAIPIG